MILIFVRVERAFVPVERSFVMVERVFVQVERAFVPVERAFVQVEGSFVQVERASSFPMKQMERILIFSLDERQEFLHPHIHLRRAMANNLDRSDHLKKSFYEGEKPPL